MTKLTPPKEVINFTPTLLQHKAWNYLTDNETTILLFGGSAGSGKSFLGCSFIVLQCLQYPGVVGGITRARIIDLKRSTLITLLDVLKKFNCFEGEQYQFDRQTNIITFYNGSKIILFDSYYYPNDVEFERISSTEFTSVLIDEASQITKKAFSVIQTRIRFAHEKYNLIPKLLVVTNPTLNFIKSEIYEPYIKGTLQDHIKVVLGLVTDNPYIDKSYIENLERMDGPIKSRLLYGDWNYASNDESIFNSEKLVNVFYNSVFYNQDKRKFLTCDVASSGQDKTCITLWEGMDCYDIHLYHHKTIPQLYEIITGLMREHHIPISNVSVDKSGVGVGLFDMLKGCIGFVANERPSNNIYSMLKDELFYKFADFINNDRVLISCKKYKDEIVQELGAHIMYNYDKDNTKTQILPKDKVKASIGRSPDIADALVMRMIFEVKQNGFSFSFV